MKNWQKLLAPLLILVLLLAACGGSGEAKKKMERFKFTRLFILSLT
ncbi:hypothetical protein [Listeria aquatica]